MFKSRKRVKYYTKLALRYNEQLEELAAAKGVSKEVAKDMMSNFIADKQIVVNRVSTIIAIACLIFGISLSVIYDSLGMI